jgi:hypothetical protein
VVNINLVASATTLPQSSQHVVAAARLADGAARSRLSCCVLTRRLRHTSSGSPDGHAGRTRRSEGLYLSPITEGAQTTPSRWSADWRGRRLDGIHLDYTRYPSLDFDYSASALQAFRAARMPAVPPDVRARLDQSAQADPLVWTREFPEGWNAFRLDRLTTLVQRIRAAVKAARPDAVLSSAVVPDPPTRAAICKTGRLGPTRASGRHLPHGLRARPEAFADQ